MKKRCGTRTEVRAAFMVVLMLVGSEGCSPAPQTTAVVPPAPDGDRSCGAHDSALVFDYTGEKTGGIPRPWVVQVKTGESEVRIVEPSALGGEAAAYLHCVKASFSLNREVDVNVKDYQRLCWEWMADQLPTSNQVNPEGSKDQALQIYLYFDGGRVLSYHWDTNRLKGTTYDDSIPFLVSIKVMVVESGSERVGKWTRETRNIYMDYKASFHAEPPALRALRSQSNSQHTASVGSGYVSKFTFTKE